MGERTSIEWTEATWNPVRGCTRVSEGCRHCYAERVAARFSGPGQPYEGLAVMTPSGPRWTGQVRLVPEHLEDPLQWTRPRRIFVNSMSDLFHESLQDHEIDAVFAVMAQSPRHVFQVLTKRPERLAAYVLNESRQDAIDEAGCSLFGWCHSNVQDRWPLPNVWLGLSAENQAAFDRRWPHMRRVAEVGWLTWCSAEPLLGPINAAPALREGLRWVVVGGESGPGARPMHPDWATSLRDQCQQAGVPFLFKQWGDWLHEDQEHSYAATIEELAHFGARYLDALRGPLLDQQTRWEALMAAGPHHDWADGTGVSVRVGKKRAGRALDGRTWDQYPVNGQQEAS